ncbi:hypothetical protein [Chloroflexus sp.]
MSTTRSVTAHDQTKPSAGQNVDQAKIGSTMARLLGKMPSG